MPKPLSDFNDLISHIALYNSQAAYAKLFKVLFPSLYRFCYCFLKSRELAEEAASDVMITLWRNRHKLAEIHNVKVYAFVIAKNISLNLINRQHKKEQISLDEIQIDPILDTLNPEQMLINQELKRKLEIATRMLPAQCQLVFKLIKEDGMSYKEAGAVLNISSKTVDAHLVNAVKKLTSILKTEFNLM